MIRPFFWIAVVSSVQASYFITKVNETVHHNIVLRQNEAWNPEMYAKKIILRNLTGVITSRSFSILNNVEEIYFVHSNITALHDDAFLSTPKLKILQFSYNNHLPMITNNLMRNCKNLKKFIMGHNKEVEGISGNLFSNLRTLSEIEITKENKFVNRISKSLFENSVSVKSIKLHFCNITLIDSDAFEDLNELEFLSFVENDIVEIGENAFRSPNLKEIYLGWNKIKIFSGRELNSTENLKILDISYNPLAVVDLDQVKQNAPNIKFLYLTHTNLSCNGKMNEEVKESPSLQKRINVMDC